MVNNDEEYLKQLGYRDPMKILLHVPDGDEEWIPDAVVLLAEWENGSKSVHSNVPNSVRGAFWELDECGDPAACRRIWVSPQGDVIDTDQQQAMDWRALAANIPVG